MGGRLELSPIFADTNLVHALFYKLRSILTEKELELELLGKKVHAFVILKDAAQLPSKEGKSSPTSCVLLRDNCARHILALLTLMSQQPGRVAFLSLLNEKIERNLIWSKITQ